MAPTESKIMMPTESKETKAMTFTESKAMTPRESKKVCVVSPIPAEHIGTSSRDLHIPQHIPQLEAEAGYRLDRKGPTIKTLTSVMKVADRLQTIPKWVWHFY